MYDSLTDPCPSTAELFLQPLAPSPSAPRLVVTVVPAARLLSSLLASLCTPLSPVPHGLCSVASGHGAMSDRLVFLDHSVALCASCGLPSVRRTLLSNGKAFSFFTTQASAPASQE